MSRITLQAFLDELVVEMAKESPLLRQDYNLNPHTFIFTPFNLGTQMIRAAENSAKDGWKVTSADKKEIRMLANKQGKFLVDYIKTLGGKDYAKNGVKLRFVTTTKQEVLNPIWKRFPNAPKIFLEADIFHKIKSAYSDTMEAYFESVQHYLKNQDVTYKSKATGRQRGKGLRTGIAGSGGFATSEGGVQQAGHKHGEGILETQMRAAFNLTYDTHRVEMQKAGLKDSQAVYNALKELGLDISVIRADDGEGFEIQIENRTGNASMGSHAGAAKKAFLATAKTFLDGKDLGNLEGSDSIISRNRKIAIKMIEKEFKKVKGVKVKTEDTTFKTSKGKAKRTIGTPKILKPTEVELAATIALPKARRKAKRKPTPPRMALKNILGLINAKLPQQVADNMGAPRLENQTGTFAGSVRAITATETAQGFKSIGYMYQKNPYQVFESTSGTRFSSAARDPRSLIDFSIREIVAQFGLGRLYTRRL